MEPHRDMPDSRRLDDHGFQEHIRYDRDMQGPREYLHTRHVEEEPKSMRQNRVPEQPEYQWDPYREGSAGRSEERMARHPDDRRVYRGKLEFFVILILFNALIKAMFLVWFLGEKGCFYTH